MAKKEVELRVQEAMQEEAYKGIVRVDSQDMKEIGVRAGDIIEIEGGRKTVGIVDRAYPTDVGEAVIRMDGILRRNAKTSIGEQVKIRKTQVKEAKKITIAPAQKGMTIQADPAVFQRSLLGRVVLKGDIIALGGTTRRRSTLSDSPFGDIFSDIFEGLQSGGFLGGLGSIRFIVADSSPSDAVIITENTQVQVSSKTMEIKEEIFPDVTYEDIGGLSEEIRKIREMVELPMKHPELFNRLGVEPPAGVLLHGPPGTGKTLLAKAVANETDSNFVLVNGPEIMNKFYGESEKKIRQIFEDAAEKAPSIIFIDEIDAIAPKREETRGEVERRVVAQLLTMMDGLNKRGNVTVIGATNRPNAIDEALRRPGRFDREITFGVPNKKGRLEILKIHTRNMPLAKDVDIDALAEITHGFVGADLSSLAKEAAMNVLRRMIPELNLREKVNLSDELLNKLIIYDKDFKEALRIVRPSAMREVLVEKPNVKWEDIGGLENMKQELKEVVEWPMKYSDSFNRMGIKAPKGVLLYGPPGTGKTLLAKAVANETNANFLLVKGPELLSMWMGESEKGVRKIFEKARQAAPSIIFFDEVDSIASRRGMETQGTRTAERMVNQILTEMDGLEELNDVVVMAATNRPDILDPALLRPGRFDRILLVNVPDELARYEIFKVHTEDMPIGLTKEESKRINQEIEGNEEIGTSLLKKGFSGEKITPKDIKDPTKHKIKFKDLNDKDKLLYYLSQKTNHYVGSDIEAVCREAGMLTLREDINAKEITMKYFEEALKKVRPSIREQDIKKYEEIEAQYLRTARGAAIQEKSYMG
jgi:transitional endoplasmic reticulum ATPase